MKIIENVLTDRGSKYVVSGGTVTSKEEALAFVRRLCRKKKFAKTTHNAWAAILPDGTPLKNDDGETGAGMGLARLANAPVERFSVRTGRAPEHPADAGAGRGDRSDRRRHAMVWRRETGRRPVPTGSGLRAGLVR